MSIMKGSLKLFPCEESTQFSYFVKSILFKLFYNPKNRIGHLLRDEISGLKERGNEDCRGSSKARCIIRRFGIT